MNTIVLALTLALSVSAAVSEPSQAIVKADNSKIILAPNTITCPDAVPGKANQWLAFRRDFRLEKRPTEAKARIAADSKYWLWINGKQVVFEGSLKRGPNPQDSYYDEIELAPYLKKGENKIALLVWYFGRQGFSHKDSGKPQLWMECPEAIIRSSDGQWLTAIHPAYGTADCPKPNYRLPESSISFDERLNINGWQTVDSETLENKGFKPAAQIESTLGTLHPRPIPLWKDFGVKSARFENRRGEKCDTLIALLPHNMQMTPILKVSDAEGGHRILIETDHSAIGKTENLRAEYISTKGTKTYESLGWLSGMRIILTVEHGAEVKAIKYRETGYDTFAEGSFSCSDPFFNKFWQKGLRTIYVNARDTFFDCPERERAAWLGDIVVILSECFHSYSTSLHALIRKTMLEACAWQKEDGSIYGPVPSGNWIKELPVQSLATVSRYGLWTYYMHTGDLETLESCYPSVKRYLDCYSIGADGLTEYRKAEWNWGDWGGERDMHLLQTTWYCIALDGAVRMAETLGKTDDATELSERLEALRKACNEVCWTGSAYRHPAYEGQTDDRVQALAILGGIAGPEKYEALFETLKQEEHASSFMEKYVMEALFAIGEPEYAMERARKRFDFMVNHPDYDTLFESWDVGVKNWTCGSVNHAWSGAPLAVLPERMMGLMPTSPAWKSFTVAPVPGVFDSCNISFPTVAGTVASSFKRRGSFVTWKITVPEGSEASVTIPWEFSRCSLDGKKCETTTLCLGGGKHTIRIKLLSCKNF